VTGASAMRILLITGIFPPDIGGPATYVPPIASALVERGHQVTVLTLSDCLAHEDEHYPFPVVRLTRRGFRPWRWLRTIIQIIHLGCQADVLFANGLFLEAVLANRWLYKPLVQKVVGDVAWEQATNRGWVADGFEDFQQKPYDLKVETLRSLRAWWTRQADRLIVPSHYLAHWVAGWGIPEGKIAVIYNAVAPRSPSAGAGKGGARIPFTLMGEEADGGESQVPKSAHLPISTPVKLITVGRLVPWKRVDQVIEAVAHGDDVGLIIVGDGPEREHLEKLAHELGLTDRVYFAGQRSKAEVLALMTTCDLFVLNSTYEGLPHVVLEAMNLGLPVVATAVGGTPELVKDGKNGRLIAPQDGNALHDVLSELLSTPLERRRLAAGAKQLLAPFSFDAMVEATTAVLYTVARRASSR
jgi:glycosyltransferase involved in cell wall biosynthesis